MSQQKTAGLADLLRAIPCCFVFLSLPVSLYLTTASSLAFLPGRVKLRCGNLFAERRCEGRYRQEALSADAKRKRLLAFVSAFWPPENGG